MGTHTTLLVLSSIRLSMFSFLLKILNIRNDSFFTGHYLAWDSEAFTLLV